MLEKAQAHSSDRVDFRLGDVASLQGEWDLLFSHAVLHWVDDHEALIPRLWGHIKPGGQLAVQIPSNHRHPSHTCIIAAASEEPFKAALGGWVRHSPVLEIDQYAQLLHGCGADRFHGYGEGLPDLSAGSCSNSRVDQGDDPGAVFRETAAGAA